MVALDVDGLTFTFDPGWLASKYDDWTYFKRHFSGARSGLKAMDLVVVSPTMHAFLIEVKDYRTIGTGKPSDLPGAVAKKVLDTLAGLVAARLNASDAVEKNLADQFCRSTKLSVVLHCEQPSRHMPVVNIADVEMKLRQVLKSVDRRVAVTQMSSATPWSVSHTVL